MEVTDENTKLPPLETDSLTTRPQSRNYEMSSGPHPSQKSSQEEDSAVAPPEPSATTISDAPGIELGDRNTESVSKTLEATNTDTAGAADANGKKKYSKGYVKDWKITAMNLKEKINEVSGILTELKETDIMDIVRNATQFKDDIFLVTAGMYRNRNPHRAHRIELLEMLLSSGYLDFVCSLWAGFVQEFENSRAEYDPSLTDVELWAKYQSEKKHIRLAMANYGQAIVVVWNGSDIKNAKTLQSMYDSFIQHTLGVLASKYTLPLLVKTADRDPPYRISKGMLAIIFNFLQHMDHMIPDMRQRDALQIVNYYRNVNVGNRISQILRSKAILCASYLITEDDDKSSVTLNENDIAFLGKLLQNCLTASGYHSAEGYDAEELICGLNNVAVVESNKKKLVETNILPLLMTSMRTSRVTIQAAAAQTIWTISFDNESKKRVAEMDELMTELKLLSQHDDPSVQKAAKGALWQIQGESAHFNSVAPKSSSARLHIMLSYQWDVQQEVIKVRQRLQKAGYRVWIDIEQMSGSTLEAMAFAVQNTACFVPVLTEKYKASPACRLEAENAYLLQKKMVPIRHQPKYRPDGWLGFMLGSTFFYDLTKPDEYESKMDDFIKALGDRAKILPGEDAEPMQFLPEEFGDNSMGSTSMLQTQAPAPHLTPATTVSAMSTTHDINPTKLACYKWTSADVLKWLDKMSLTRFKELFDDIDGTLLVELISLQRISPDIYYGFLREEYKMTLKDVLGLNAALRRFVTDS